MYRESHHLPRIDFNCEIGLFRQSNVTDRLGGSLDETLQMSDALVLIHLVSIILHVMNMG